MHRLVVFQRLLEKLCIRTFFDFDVFKYSVECGVTAVVRPVSIQNADFCFGRIAFDGFKVFLKELNISKVHCKTHFCAVFVQFLFVE